MINFKFTNSQTITNNKRNVTKTKFTNLQQQHHNSVLRVRAYIVQFYFYSMYKSTDLRYSYKLNDS